MNTIKTIKDVVDSNLCLGCGLCSMNSKIRMKYSKSKGQYLPVNVSTPINDEFEICPAKGYEIKKMSEALFEGGIKYNIDLGYVDKLLVATSTIEKVLENASSGGVMTQILLYLLEEKIVDKVVVTKFEYTSNGPQSCTVLTDSVDEIIAAQGSKYCPVNLDECLQQILKSENEKICFVGTPCQIAGVRKLQEKFPRLKKNIVITIGNFCGGFKSFKNIEKIATRHALKYKNISYMRFRGGGQPGSLLIKDTYGHQYQAPYPSYSGFTGYSKLLRCHLCVDATAELADIACGDAWIDRLLEDDKTWSVVITRNAFSTSVIEDMIKKEIILSGKISVDEVCYSQRQNLKSKKYRYLSRNKLYKMLGYKLPNFDGGYVNKESSLKTEVMVFLTHRFKAFLEIISCYKYFRIIIGKKY